jgi:hypothetical protein
MVTQHQQMDLNEAEQPRALKFKLIGDSATHWPRVLPAAAAACDNPPAPFYAYLCNRSIAAAASAFHKCA